MSITIPNSVIIIETRAFLDCTGLTSITIPDSVTTIGDYAFHDCISLTSITVNANNALFFAVDGVLFNKNQSILITCPNGKAGSYAVPNSVTTIGPNAFDSCRRLTSVTIPNSVTSIGNYAFYDCSSLTSVTIPNRLNSIGNGTFLACQSLTSITIPDSVTSIGGSAFYGCNSLSSITIPNSVTSIGGSAFYGCHNLTSITIPDSVTSIGDYVFYSCSSLTSVMIPDSVTTIGDYAFHDCHSLTSVTISDSVTSIGDYAFYDCRRLTSVTIPDSVTSIGAHAFEYCSSLTSVTIPDSVTSIEAYAFYSCRSLTSITLPDSVTSIETSAFGASAFYYYILTDVYYGGSEADWAAISIGDDNAGLTTATIHYNYAPEDPIVSSGSCGNLIQWSLSSEGCLTISGSGAMPDYGYPDYALWYALRTQIRRVVVEDGITHIGDCSFYNCTNLTKVSLPDSLTSIGGSAFHGCARLSAITLPSGLRSIDGDVFDGCKMLTYIVIPDGITKIEMWAFRDCSSLEEITLPLSIKQIGAWAFTGCSALTQVNYSGTSAQWYDIQIGTGNEDLLRAGGYSTGETASPSMKFSWRSNRSPIEAVSNNDNLVIAMTALAKLAYGNYNDSWVGKQIKDYADKSSGGYLEKNKDSIWRVDGREYGSYSQFYTDTVGSFEIVDYYDDNNSSGLYAVCFRAPDGKYIVSYRGSEDFLTGTGKIDWSADLDFALRDKLSKQFLLALYYYYEIEDLAGGRNNVVVTGHSLGGALAAYVSICTGVRGYPVDGAVGHIIDTAFWESSSLIADFSGADALNFVNLTDEVGISTVADLIQATRRFTYPMVTFKTLHVDDAADSEGIAGRITALIGGPHHQMSFLDYDETTGKYVLGAIAGTYDCGSSWREDIRDYYPSLLAGVDPGVVSGALVGGFGGAIVGGVIGGAVTSIDVNLFKEGRVIVGSSSSDVLIPSRILGIDSIRNVVYGGTGVDVLEGYNAEDILVANGRGSRLDGKGGDDTYYIIIAEGSVSINDPGGKDTIILRNWDVDQITTYKQSIQTMITDGTRTVTINSKRSWLTKGSVTVKAFNEKTGAYRTFTLDIDATLLAENEQDAMRIVLVEGTADIVVCGADGAALGDTVFSNASGDSIVYTDYAYYYGYNNEDDDPYAEIYLFNEGSTVRLAGEQLSVQVFQYDDDESGLVGGSSAENISSAENGCLEIVTTGNNQGFYSVDASGNRAELESVTTFVYAESVSLSEDEITLEPRATKTLTVTAEPAGSILDGSWMSSNPLVATVEDGVVTAKAEGVAEISFTTASGKSAVCTVTVIAQELLTASITGTTMTYTATPPEGTSATLIIAWYDENGRMVNCVLKEAGTGDMSVEPNYSYKLFLVEEGSFLPLFRALEPVKDNAQ